MLTCASLLFCDDRDRDAPARTHPRVQWALPSSYVTEEDIKNCTADEHSVIDRLIDRGVTVVGVLDREIIESLYRRNLIYLGTESQFMLP